MKKGQGLQDWQMLSIRMPKEQAARLGAKANQVGISKSALVLTWIDLKLSESDAQLQRNTKRRVNADDHHTAQGVETY